jgi:hypothetical protein
LIVVQKGSLLLLFVLEIFQQSSYPEQSDDKSITKTESWSANESAISLSQDLRGISTDPSTIASVTLGVGPYLVILQNSSQCQPMMSAMEPGRDLTRQEGG